jgi:hypothetical protein
MELGLIYCQSAAGRYFNEFHRGTQLKELDRPSQASP